MPLSTASGRAWSWTASKVVMKSSTRARPCGRSRESRDRNTRRLPWTPAFAGVTSGGGDDESRSENSLSFLRHLCGGAEGSPGWELRWRRLCSFAMTRRRNLRELRRLYTSYFALKEITPPTRETGTCTGVPWFPLHGRSRRHFALPGRPRLRAAAHPH